MTARMVAFASAQHGIVDMRELLAAGLARSTVSHWARSGRLFRIHPGVFSVIPPQILSQEGRWLGAVKTCAPNAFLSHGPAGQLQGIVPRKHRHALEVSLSDRRVINPAGILVHRPRRLEPRETLRRRGIPATNATRTVWDMSANHSATAVRRAFEQAEKFGWLERDRLEALASEAPNRKGSGVIRALLDDRIVPLSEVRSWLEELLLTICVDHSLPFPAVNVPLLGYEVDFLWESARFVVEADGADHMNRDQRDRDNSRDFRMQRAGFLVRRYSSRDMGRGREIAGEVTAVLRARI